MSWAELQDRACRHRRTEDAAGAGIVPGAVAACRRGRADPNGGFVAPHDGVQKHGAVGAVPLRRGKRCRHDHVSGVEDCRAMKVVELEHVAETAIDERGLAGGPAAGSRGEARTAFIHTVCSQGHSGRGGGADQRAAEPVEEMQHGAFAVGLLNLPGADFDQVFAQRRGHGCKSDTVTGARKHLPGTFRAMAWPAGQNSGCLRTGAPVRLVQQRRAAIAREHARNATAALST